MPGYEARLVDEHGQSVPAGELGDLVVRGDSTCAFYWNRHEQTKDTISGHWIRTGDKYRQDDDGFFWFAGQCGFGIQTAPVAAKLAAALLLGIAPEAMASGVDPAPYSAGRFAA